MRRFIRPLSFLLLLPLLSSCTTRLWQAQFLSPKEEVVIDTEAPFLKCHTPKGEVYVLTDWEVHEQKRTVSGQGILYDTARQAKSRGAFTLSFDEVALFETNRPELFQDSGAMVMGVLTGASVALSVLCLTNPKACFGSCPTFYAHDGQQQVLQAEGFSDAIAPALESTDVDALYTARPAGPQLELQMTNEALETHAVRSVRLLAVPRPAGGRVFQVKDRFVVARSLLAPRACQAESGDCLPAVSAVDGAEYHSLADEKDLATHEVLELSFPAGSGRRGLVVGGRNSLLNTFLLYQVMAYAGGTLGERLLQLPRADQSREVLASMGKLLGDVEAQVLTRRGWVAAGAFSETGPLAREVKLIPLPEDLPEGELRVRLRLAKGHWRLDYLALAELQGEARAEPVLPSKVERNGVEDAAALARLLSPSQHLVTYPGDAYTLRFELPEGEHELFLESHGYYYEWVRKAWLAERDEEKLLEALFEPEKTLRRLAPAFKKVEPDMERIFWESRFGRTP